MKVGENTIQDLNVQEEIVRVRRSFKYLGVALASGGKDIEDMNDKIGQDKRTFRQLNSVL